MDSIKLCYRCCLEFRSNLVECPGCGRTLVYPPSPPPPPLEDEQEKEDPPKGEVIMPDTKTGPEPIEDGMTWSEAPPPELPKDPPEGPGEIEEPEA